MSDAPRQERLRTYGIYRLSPGSLPTFTSAAEILASLDRSVPIQHAHALAVEKLCREGERYTRESSDVCSAAWCAREQLVTTDYERGWVAAMLALVR